MHSTNNIGQRVRALRENLGITQQELADRIGFVRNYISLVENGRKPSHRFIRALELIEQAPVTNIAQTSIVREEPFAATPRGLIKARRKELGLSLEELARQTGYQKSTLLNVEEGHTRASEKMLRKLAERLDLPIEDLMGGSDYPHYIGAGRTTGAEANIVTPPGITARVIPLLSWAQAGTTQAWDDVYEHEGFTGFNVRDPKAVAIQIRGDSMEPQFPQGTIAIVYPSIEAKSGDLVIARLSDGTVMFKRLHVDGDHYTFISLNPIYPPRTVEKSKIEKLLAVGGTFRSEL
jgi:transcriptional regulator with XRE-family HTH domain